jgi:hypothetical protein
LAPDSSRPFFGSVNSLCSKTPHGPNVQAISPPVAATSKMRLTHQTPTRSRP